MTSPMRYGEWLNTALRRLIGDVVIWVLSIPWMLLRWFSLVILGISIIGMEYRVASLGQHPHLFIPLLVADSPWAVLRGVFRVYRYLVGLPTGILIGGFFFALLAWVLRAFVAGGVIYRTMPSWTHPPRWQESLHVGLERGFHLLVIDVLFALPVVILGLLFGTLTGAMLSRWIQAPQHTPLIPILGLCLTVPLLLFWLLVTLFLRPLMYQACVQERLPFWEAVERGLRIAWRRSGPTLVLGMTCMGVSLANGILTRIVTLPLGIVGPRAQGFTAMAMYILWLGAGLLLVLLFTAQQLFVWSFYAQAWPALAEPSS